MKQEKQKEEITWYRSDLAYEHLHRIKMAVSIYAGGGDLQGWCNALETEFRFVWPYIIELVKEKGYNKESFDDAFSNIRQLLYSPHYNKSESGLRKKSRNYAKARGMLHELNMLFNEYEVTVGLGITREPGKDPNRAMMKYGG